MVGDIEGGTKGLETRMSISCILMSSIEVGTERFLAMTYNVQVIRRLIPVLPKGSI